MKALETKYVRRMRVYECNVNVSAHTHKPRLVHVTVKCKYSYIVQMEMWDTVLLFKLNEGTVKYL